MIFAQEVETVRLAVSILFLAGLSAAVVYAALSVISLHAFLKEKPRTAQVWPALSLLKPIRGVSESLEANLRTMLGQDYPEFEVLFGFQDPDDPAISLVETLCAEYPEVRTEIVRAGEARGPNRKACVLKELARRARHDIFVISDQDMRVGRRYLRAVAAEFEDPRVGLTTLPYRTTEARGVGAVFEALAVDADFIPSALVAKRLEGLTFALGATMAPRRAALAAIGGFEALEDFLADDYELGNRIHNAGYRITLCPYFVTNVVDAASLRSFFLHQLRWNRGYRVCRPTGYLGSVLMNGMVFAVGLALVTGWWQAIPGWLAVRLFTAREILRALGVREEWWLAFVPLKDVINFALWLLALRGNTVWWGGDRFVLHPDGRMQPA
ncbi:MAG: glycosyltransferase [Armatimonadetes bacterium]|nr:glycosyltransferase [Armatimonadota bacterium]